MQENCGPNEAAERLSDFTTIARELIAYGRTCKRMETPFQTAKKSAGQWVGGAPEKHRYSTFRSSPILSFLRLGL